jgi:Tol biopolymer transport system component
VRSLRTRFPSLVVATLVFGACAGVQVSPSTSASQTAAPASTAPATETPVSIGPTFAAFPAPNVEGQIVFEDAGDNFVNTQIWIENADGSNVRKIVSDAFTDNGVSLSPDGTMVAFYQLADPNAFGRIMLAKLDGSDIRELETGSRQEGCDAGPEGTNPWSPDGHRLAFTRTCFGREGSYVGQGLWTVNLDGTEPREVTHNAPEKPCPPPFDSCAPLEDHRASWSPDGKRLAFARIDTSMSLERSAIFTIDVDGKNLRQVTPWKLDANDPDWSPDGTLIAFNSPAEAGGDQKIYTIRPDGTGLTRLTSGLSTYADGGQGTYHPSWSPDGTQILFSHSPSTDGFADLFVMNSDGSGVHVLAKTELHENHAAWGRSPAP